MSSWWWLASWVGGRPNISSWNKSWVCKCLDNQSKSTDKNVWFFCRGFSLTMICFHNPEDPCMVYLPTFSWFFMVNVGKYIIHGSCGLWKQHFHNFSSKFVYRIFHIFFLILHKLYWDSWTIMGSLANMFKIRTWKRSANMTRDSLLPLLEVKAFPILLYQTRTLVGDFNPNCNTLVSLVKLDSSSPRFGIENKHLWNYHLVTSWQFSILLLSFTSFGAFILISCSDTGNLSKAMKQPNKGQLFVSEKSMDIIPFWYCPIVALNVKG